MVVDHGQRDLGMVFFEAGDGRGDECRERGREAAEPELSAPAAGDLRELLLGVIQAREHYSRVLYECVSGLGQPDRAG